MGGIYKILNNFNGKCYYGSTIDFTQRQSDHFNTLKNNVHVNKHLQNSYNLHPNNFEFIIIKEVQDNLLLEEEQKYIDQYWDGGQQCYNIAKIAGKPPTLYGEDNGFYGKTHTEETRKIMSEKRKILLKENPSLIKRGKENHMYGITWTEERKKELSEKTKGVNSPNYGVKFSEETRKKISESKIGIAMSQETKDKISNSMTGDKNPFFNKTHTEETRKIMSEKKKELLKDPTKNYSYGRKGSLNPRSKAVIQIDNITKEHIRKFESAGQASEFFNGDNRSGSSSIIAVCRGRKLSYKGYRWIYA